MAIGGTALLGDFTNIIFKTEFFLNDGVFDCIFKLNFSKTIGHPLSLRQSERNNGVGDVTIEETLLKNCIF